MYALVNKEILLLGPIKFNTRMFNSELDDIAEEYDIEIGKKITLNDEGQVPLNVFTNDEVDLWILPTETQQPNFNPDTEFIIGPTHQVTPQEKVSFTWTVQDKTLEQVKSEKISKLPEIRYNKEQTGIVTYTLEGNDIEVSTSRENRLSLISKSSSINSESNYKFGENWVTVSNTDLQNIISLIDTKVQEFFDWELSKINEINSCTDVESVINVVIQEPVEEIPDVLQSNN